MTIPAGRADWLPSKAGEWGCLKAVQGECFVKHGAWAQAAARPSAESVNAAMAAWVLACLAWLAGVALQLAEPALWPARAYGAGGLLSVAVLGLLARSRSSARRAAVAWSGALLAVAVLAWALTGWRAGYLMSQQVPAAWLGHDLPVDVQVTGLPQSVAGGVLFDARVLRWQASTPAQRGLPDKAGAAAMPCCLPAQLSLRMNASEAPLLVAGQRWHLMVRLHAPDGLSNPDGFDSTLSFFERGVRAIGQVRDRGAAPVKWSDEPEYFWQGAIDRYRQRTRDAILRHVDDPRVAGVLAGLSVGDQSAIDRDDWQVFRRTGVAHLVSISGAHIAMFGWLAAALVRRLWSRWPAGVHTVPAPELARWAAVLASGLYALLAGWGVPAQRTVWMMLIMTLLRSGGRRWPWPLVWLGSAVVITALDPWALRQAGFWLSYVAVAVLMSSGPQPVKPGADTVDADIGQAPAQRSAIRASMWSAVSDAGREMLRTQWLVTLALTPLAAVCFGQVSVVSVVSNMAAIPLFTLGITPLALLGMIWPPLWALGAALVQWTLQGLTYLSAVPWAVVQALALPWWVASGVILAGFVQALDIPWRWRLLALPFLMPLLHLPHSWRLLPAPLPGQFQLLAADVGQGTAVLVRTARHSLLFDTGPRIGTQGDAGDRVLLPLMRALGMNGLDVLLISHQDTDHVGGAAAIVRELPVGRLLSSLDDAHPLLQQPGSLGQVLPHEACTAGQHWAWDGVDFTVLHPTPQDYARRAELPSNALSCVLRVSRVAEPSVSALLTGDIEAAQEAALLARTDASALRSTVLLAPHHGSKTSSTEPFLQAVQPDQLVIQVGRRNAYKHPSPPVLDRYDAMGLPWQSTPACGAYVWNSGALQAKGASAASAVNAATAVSGALSGARQPMYATPAVGECWRSKHRHYWDGALPLAAEGAVSAN
jgi:competence protein ComEC